MSVARHAEHAGPGAYFQWQRDVRAALDQCIATLPEFTTDDVWLALGRTGDIEPVKQKTMGAIMREASAGGRIVKTGRQGTSQFRVRRGRKITIWKATGRPRG